MHISCNQRSSSVFIVPDFYTHHITKNDPHSFNGQLFSSSLPFGALTEILAATVITQNVKNGVDTKRTLRGTGSTPTFASERFHCARENAFRELNPAGALHNRIKVSDCPLAIKTEAVGKEEGVACNSLGAVVTKMYIL